MKDWAGDKNFQKRGCPNVHITPKKNRCTFGPEQFSKFFRPKRTPIWPPKTKKRQKWPFLGPKTPGEGPLEGVRTPPDPPPGPKNKKNYKNFFIGGSKNIFTRQKIFSSHDKKYFHTTKNIFITRQKIFSSHDKKYFHTR